MSIVIDLNVVCLVCLQEQEGASASSGADSMQLAQMKSIYESDDDDETIIDKIASCSELRLSGGHHPDKICACCLGDLAVAWRFRLQCEQAAAVFATIQQQEEQANLEASRELEQQKIRLPKIPGLKIKRIQPATKTYLLPVQQLDEEGEEEQVAIAVTVVGEVHEKHERVLEERISSDQLSVVVEEEVAEEKPDLSGEYEDTDDEEQHVVDFDDYYETEELLDEDTKAHMERMEDDMTPVTPLNVPKVISDDDDDDDDDEVEDTRIKVERQYDSDEVAEQAAKVKRLVAEQLPPFRRPRGRPKKIIKTEHEVAMEMSRPTIIRIEKENLKATSDSSSSLRQQTTQGARKKPPPSQTRKQLKSRSPQSDVGEALPRPAKICEICGNSYKYQHALNAHMRRHTNTRPFSCEFCDKAFVSAVELRRHMRVHTGHKPYSCQFCDRRFSDFGSRIKHERTHTGERPYKCGTCAKSFAYAHVLTVHVRTHTGEKKFQCSRCGKGFTKKIYLASHMRQHSHLMKSVAIVVRGQEDFETEDSYHPHQQQQQQPTESGGELMEIDTVAQEECIFTTKYVVEGEDGGDSIKDEHDDEIYEISEVEEGRAGGGGNMSEEHLVDDLTN